MKILVGGIYHESHSFSNVSTNLDAFRKVLLLEGQEVLDVLEGTTSEMSGFIQGAKRFGCELVPTVWAWGTSTGPVEAGTLDYLLEVVKQRLRTSGPVDGVLFALHGALVAEQSLDGDGYILTELRSMVTNAVPIAVTVDFHANISKLMVEVADVIVGYDTYPHIDQVERGLEAAELLVATIRGDIQPTMVLEKPAIVIVPNKQCTDTAPMKEILSMAHAAENSVLSVTISGGFAYSDVPEIGPSVVVVTNNQPEIAGNIAKEISHRMWTLRDQFSSNLPSVSEAVQYAISSDVWPVILADIGDNIGAGTPGDSTFILRELLKQKAQGAIVTIADAESVALAIEAGLRKRINLEVGGKCDAHHGDPVKLSGTVDVISDGIFRNQGHMRDGIIENMGRTVVIKSGGVKLVLTEVKMPPWNLEQLRSVGISPETAKIIALKSAVAFRAAYEPIAGKIIEVNTPGLSTVDLQRFRYKHIRRPLFPIDSI